jgi:tetratricopeptide (TPR) repeat protein
MTNGQMTNCETARSREILRAVFVGAVLGVLLSGLTIFVLQIGEPDLIEQKLISLRYRVSALLPQSAHPEFAPTPLAISTPLPTETAAPTATPVPTLSNGTPIPTRKAAPTRTPTRAPTLAPGVIPIQPSVALPKIKADYQRWNNCGPTTLGMALQYFGRADTQAEIAAFTKPNPDDRNVRPDELAAYAHHVGLRSIIRVNGTMERLELFLSNGLPVIVETALVKQPQGWMGHYRLLIGYDAKQFNTMDSYDGPNVKISFGDLDVEWRAFNRLYLVIYSEEQATRVRAILADTLDDATMYAQAAARARAESDADPKDAFAQFNLGSSLVALKRYAEAAAAFDRARTLGLPWRMMWYHFSPYEAYLHVGRYDEVIALADALLSKTDDLEEAHYYKGLALRALSRPEEARREFETALRYNSNYREAQKALE